ncbi:MAG TPA: T9SS type A sorting domain-containing protein [Chitinophagaceae bacterium]|nr:T9SS type A sorting domain-containing protein [Chitinophagaceae bacterium]
MKTFVLSMAALLALVTSKAQFSENFNSVTIPGLTNTCWIVNGMTITNQPGEAISGTSIFTAPPTSPNSKVDLYTPMLNLLSTSSTIQFDYQLTQTLNGSATRTILVGLVNTVGVVVASNTIVMNSGTSTALQHYMHTFSISSPGVNRIFLRIMGEGGNGNVRLVLDNFQSSSTSLYSIAGNCIFTPIVESTLPVKLASFTATLSSRNKADLKWVTASEINVSHFIIERSLDGTNFSEAGMVFAYGNATDKTNYSFSDNLTTSISSVIYYRLKSVDIDGKVEYSAIRVIRMGRGKENNISILTFPNPVQNEVRITIPAAWQNKTVSYEVFNATGQVIKKMQTSASSQTETISLSTMASGFYMVKASCGAESAQQRIVKQ